MASTEADLAGQYSRAIGRGRSAFLPSVRVRLTLLARFTLVSLTLTLLIAIGFSWLISRQMIDDALDDAAREAAETVSALITPQVIADDFASPTPARVAAWQRRIGRVVGGTDIVRVKVWSARGLLVYSDDPNLIGQIFPLEANEELREALDGHLAKELSGLEKAEHSAERSYGYLFEVYVPVVLPGTSKVAGAYEVYRAFAPLQTRIAAINLLVWGGSAAAFSLLYAALFVLMSRTSRQLSRLASFPELNPNPIVETDLSGKITYVNPETARLFPDLRLLGLRHPMLADLKSMPPDLRRAQKGALIREVKIGDVHYQQVVSHVPESGAVRIYSLDVTERKQAEERTQRQLERLAALRTIDNAITASLELPVTLRVVLEQVTTQLRVDAADVMLLNPHTQMLEHAAGLGFRTTAIARSRLRMGEGHPGLAALERRILWIPSLPDADNFVRASLLAGEDFVAYYGVPLIAKGRVMGVLEVFHRHPLDPDHEWIDFAETLAGQAAIAIDNAALFDGLQRANTDLIRAYDRTLEGWSRALELRDHETEGHTQRVTGLTLRLARVLGVSHEQVAHIRRGALLHDIGKMGIPDAILRKPGPLTDAEWKIMRRHPVYAYELLLPITHLRPALDIPYCHHEKWDGTGYPRGLKGEQIPLAARIFAVVDVWDALRSDRPYRRSWTEERVREYIREQSGKHFDPRVVEAFSTLLQPSD